MVEVIAQSIGINGLSPDAALALAPDVEYRMLEIMQEAIKCMHHSKRTTLTTDDVDSALSMRNVEPIYGFASGDPLRFKKALGHKDFFYIDDKDIDFKDVRTSLISYSQDLDAHDNRMYSRSHFTKAMELFILLVVYQAYGEAATSSMAYFFLTVSMWFLVVSWLFAPFLFNPSGFEWQKIVEDWEDWSTWISNRGGIGVPANKSWESWWEEEQEHLQFTGFIGRLMEVFLSLRFFCYQYGIVYQLRVSQSDKGIMIYGLSWIVILAVIVILKIVSMGRKKFSADFQLMGRKKFSTRNGCCSKMTARF